MVIPEVVDEAQEIRKTVYQVTIGCFVAIMMVFLFASGMALYAGIYIIVPKGD